MVKLFDCWGAKVGKMGMLAFNSIFGFKSLHHKTNVFMTINPLIDVDPICIILVKNGEPNMISAILKMQEVKHNSWEDALNWLWSAERFDKKGYFQKAIVSENIMGWCYVIFDTNSDLKYALNACNDFSKQYDEIYHFSIDGHTGLSRFIKIQDGKIIRLFERDCNQVTGEFGDETLEELEVEKENVEHSYFHANYVLERVLRVGELNKNSQAFKELVLVGQRYYREIEKHKNLYMETDIDVLNKLGDSLENEDLPF